MATPGVQREGRLSVQDNAANNHILNRAEFIYGTKSDPKIPVNKPDIDGRGEQLIFQGLGALSNVLFPGIGSITGAGLSTLGGMRSPESKQSKINDLVKNYGTYNPDTNQYSRLDNTTQRLYNITPDQVSSSIVNKQKNAFENATEVRELLAAGKTRDEVFPKGALTRADEITQFNNNYKAELLLRNEINSTTMGPELLADAEAKLGRKLNKTELLKLKTTAAIEDPNEKRAQSRETRAVSAEERAIDAQEDSRRQINSSIRVNEANQNLNSIIARNNIKTERAKIDYENKANERQFQIAQMEIDEARRSSELDRQLRRDIAILGIDDKAAERSYQARRDERKDRQIFMLQLMKGLGNLGSSLSAYML